MRYLYSEKEAKAIDSHAIHTVGIPSIVLMERAAMTAAAVLIERENKDKRFLAVCGTGNNGGDGVAVARILCHQGYKAAVTVIGQSEDMSEEMKKQLEIAINCQVPVLPPTAITDGEFDVFLDGIFGIGLSREVTGVYAGVLEQMNESGATVYALDVPSGIHAGTGQVLGTAVKADCTITFGVNKAGLVFYPGASYAGEVMVGDIGFPTASLQSVAPQMYYFEPEDLPGLFPERHPRSHKGSFGRVLVIAGCETMSGAAYLSAKAAYAAGAGLVRVLSAPCNRDVLLGALPEILFSCPEKLEEAVDWADAIVIGPGLGLEQTAEDMVRYVIAHAAVPTVVDGDAITLCRRVADTLKENFVLTPHVKEMSYLTDIPIANLQRDIPSTTAEAAGRWNCVVVQKDARTVVSNGTECYVNVSGNHGMATGGAGDVLAGITGGLLAQGMNPFDAAKLAVYWHGLSGDHMVLEKGAYGLMASDLITGMSKVTCP